MVFKLIKTGQPSYLNSLLTPYQINSDMSLRSVKNGRFCQPFLSRNRTVDRCFEHAVPRLYNKLPLEIRSQTTVPAFKSKLKTFLFRMAYNLLDKTIYSLYQL